MNEEILIEQYKESECPEYSYFYEVAKELSRLYIKKSIVEHYKDEIIINLNLGEKILLRINLDICDLKPTTVLFDICRDGELLVLNDLPIKEIVDKLVKIQNKLSLC